MRRTRQARIEAVQRAQDLQIARLVIDEGVFFEVHAGFARLLYQSSQVIIAPTTYSKPASNRWSSLRPTGLTR